MSKHECDINVWTLLYAWNQSFWEMKNAMDLLSSSLEHEEIVIAELRREGHGSNLFT